MADLAYLPDGTPVSIPDIRVTHKSGQTYEPLRGNAYVLAAFKGKKCIGWVAVEDLGYDSVKEWMADSPEERYWK